MQTLAITLVQTHQYWEDKAANLAHFAKLLDGVETDLILLPEMFQTGFSMNAENLAEKFDSSPSIEWLKQMAHHKDAAIYTSLIVEENNHYFNRGVFVHPNGKVEIYDKRKTFSLAHEDEHFASGNKETIVHFLGWNFQLQICYDLRFPEMARNRILSNQLPAYNVILYVANWPDKRVHHWNTLLTARAIENQCFVAGVNRIGLDHNELIYSGESQLVDALGNATKCKKNQEEVKTIVIKKDDLLKIREMLPFLKDQ